MDQMKQEVQDQMLQVKLGYKYSVINQHLYSKIEREPFLFFFCFVEMLAKHGPKQRIVDKRGTGRGREVRNKRKDCCQNDTVNVSELCCVVMHSAFNTIIHVNYESH